MRPPEMLERTQQRHGGQEEEQEKELKRID